MSRMDGEISHVSDTALMTAAFRAIETTRQHGLIRDPFAERLAGERGMAIALNLPGKEVLSFGVGIRSRFVDELVLHAVTVEKVATIVMVGCGLDSRPWRLDLPSELRWIEVDFPDVLEYKAERLAGEQPQCRLERIRADLDNASDRRTVFAAAGRAPGLMITEGLLMYLRGETVEALAAEAAAGGGVRYWLLDAASPEMSQRLQMPDSIQKVRAAGHLNGREILEVARKHGWAPLLWRSYSTDAWRVAEDRLRLMLGDNFESVRASRLPDDDPSGIHLLGRA